MTKNDVQEGLEIRGVSKGVPKWLRWCLEGASGGHLGQFFDDSGVYFYSVLLLFSCVHSIRFQPLFQSQSEFPSLFYLCKNSFFAPQLLQGGCSCFVFVAGFWGVFLQRSLALFLLITMVMPALEKTLCHTELLSHGILTRLLCHTAAAEGAKLSTISTKVQEFQPKCNSFPIRE